ncbi:hypothetical protein [Pseudoduganella namucuonensis]|uniref:Uncharacterized protein n=1 Tax=Pseudoduganella namucuonensis TaxID=1035707 RepID=A0A1I7LW41_9BURK|nr:hypothetical protein [Pseudoduganella namucuonensis]SFV13892.1 hypothetical protein SAMN05216552_104035 [Pseudoduganella namucuonensis]
MNVEIPPSAPEIKTMSRSMFDHNRVGVTFKGIAHRKPQGGQAAERPPRQAIGNRRSLSEKSAAPTDDTGLFDDDQETLPYRVAARSALDSMLQDDSEKNREQITEALAQIHEPLQQFTVLFGAMKEVDNRGGIGDKQKQSLKNAFNEMMTNLVNRDRGAIRKGLREGADNSPVAASLDAARAARGLSTDLRDLRFKVGARARGGVDEELSPLVMATTLLKTVGAAYTEEAMESVCSRLMPGLRTRSAFKEAAYSLTFSDAITFSIARTGFKVARDLRRDLLEMAGVLCKPHHVEAATTLFTAAEQGWGKGKANQLVNQLVDLAGSAPLTRAKVYTVVRHAIDTLPATTWPQEKKAAKGDLLEDLDRQVLNAYAEIPLLTTKAERKEEEWRNQYAAGRAPTPVAN